MTNSEMREGAGIEEGKKYEVSKRVSIFILTILTLLYVLNFMDRQVLSAVIEPMKADLGLTDAQAGFLLTIFQISIAVFMLPAAMLVDRWSRRKAISLMAILWSAATVATGMGKSFFHLSMARLFTGVGEAGYTAGGNSWLSLAFPKEARAKVMGIFGMGVPLGAALGVALGGAIATSTGSWRAPFFIFAIPGIVLGIVSFFMPDYATVKSEEEKALSREFLNEVMGAFRIKTYPWLILGGALASFYMFSFLAWLPPLFMRSYDMSTAKAGGIVGITLLAGIFGVILGGVIADIWQRRNSRGRMLFLMIITAVATITKMLFVLFMGKPLGLLILIGIIDGFFSPIAIILCQTIVADICPPRFRSSAVGIFFFLIVILGTAWGPIVIGAISDAIGGGATGLQYGILVTAPAGLIAALFFFLGSRTYPEDSARVSDEVMAEK